MVYEDEYVFAFLDIHPLSLGHTVVIPKIHAENILGLDDKSVGPLFLAVKKIAATLQKVIKPRGFTIGINHGKHAGQTIDHLHIHIIPRFAGDNGGSIHTIIKNSPIDIDLKVLAEKIRRGL